MNTFRRKSLFIAVLTGALLSGCGLTQKQMEALNGGMCFKAYGTTTTLAAGKTGVVVNGENCSIVTQGVAK